MHLPNTPRRLPSTLLCVLAAAALALVPGPARAATVAEVLPLTDRILLVHFREGHVQYHERGQARGEDRVFIAPLDVAAAEQAETYRITSDDDPAYAGSTQPSAVARKSKPTEFAWYVDRFESGRTINDRPDHVREHWLYLQLPQPLRTGKTYRLHTGPLATNGREWSLTVTAATRSEAVHVNTLGYVPGAPEKFGYVYHWMGNADGLELPAAEQRRFDLIDQTSGRTVFSGRLRHRAGPDRRETNHPDDSPPHGSFLKATVWECDFSAFDTPGRYVLSVEGVGASWPFRLAADVYREPYYHVIRGLYHNRSGIALRRPFTEFERPAPHHPRLTPGFADRLLYTRLRYRDWGSEGGDAAALRAGVKGVLTNTWGWYQDAGDWDGYESHLRVAQELLFTFELHPRKFPDAELGIPESGNGVPDVLDEAAWVPRYCHRLRHELLARGWGSGGVSLRVAGDAFGGDEKVLPDGRRVGQGSWEDVNRDWVVAGEDPWSTYRYAGVAAHLAYALALAGVADPEGVDWGREARESFTWAERHTLPGDEAPERGLAAHRAYAAAALFRLTGEEAYERRFISDTAGLAAGVRFGGDERYGPWLYALGGGAGRPRAEAHARIRGAVLHQADEVVLQASARRALRWGGDLDMPMLVGQQTTPLVMEGAIAYGLTRRTDPAQARRFLGALFTTADYFLGTNSLNQSWITGVGPRFPRHIFHMDSWYNGRGTYPPGFIPYAPWRKERETPQGPWDTNWGNQFVFPAIDRWPGGERWFSNRCSPLHTEFTVHQQNGPAAALYGFLNTVDPAETAPPAPPSPAKTAAATTVPQILYWKWNETTLTGDRLDQGLADICARSGFDTVYVSFHWLDRSVFDPVLTDAIARTARYLKDRGRRLVLDLDVRDAAADFNRAFPDESAWFVERCTVPLDAAGRGDVELAPAKKLRWGKSVTSGPESVVAAFAVEVAAGLDYAPDSPARIEAAVRLVPLPQGRTRVEIAAGAALAGREAVVFLGHRHVVPDYFSPNLPRFVDRMFTHFGQLPLGGAGTDEWGYCLDVRWEGQLLSRLLPWSPGMSRAYAARYGRALEPDLLDLFSQPAGRPGVRLAAINRYLALLRDQMAENERSFYETTKRHFGPSSLVFAHPTWLGLRHQFLLETVYNGLNWWQSPRDYAQTDEHLIIPIRLSLSRKAGGTVWYNMWYSPGEKQNIESFFQETWRNVRWGGRTHQLGYECPNEGILEFAPPGRLEAIWAMEERLQPLNAFQRAQPDSRVLVLFSMEGVSNWALSGETYPPWGERHRLMREAVDFAAGLFDAGWLCDLVPSSELSPGGLAFADGRVSYAGHAYDAVVVVAPESLDARFVTWLEGVVDVGFPVAVVGRGDYLADGSIATERLDALRARAAARPADVPATAAWLLARGVAGNRFDQGAIYTDGSVIFAADGLAPRHNRLEVDATVHGHRVEFSGEDFLALDLAPDGQPRRLAAGRIDVLRINGRDHSPSPASGKPPARD